MSDNLISLAEQRTACTVWPACRVPADQAEILLGLALEAGYVRVDGELYFAVGAVAAVLAQQEALPA